MKTVITATEAARHLGDVLARIRHRHESFILTKNDKPVAELIPAETTTTGTWADLCRAVEPLPLDPDFADDLERVNQADQPLDNPWA